MNNHVQTISLLFLWPENLMLIRRHSSLQWLICLTGARWMYTQIPTTAYEIGRQLPVMAMHTGTSANCLKKPHTTDVQLDAYRSTPAIQMKLNLCSAESIIQRSFKDPCSFTSNLVPSYLLILTSISHLFLCTSVTITKVLRSEYPRRANQGKITMTKDVNTAD